MARLFCRDDSQRYSVGADCCARRANGLGLPVTTPRARADEHLAGGSRSRVPPDGGAMLTLLRLPF